MTRHLAHHRHALPLCTAIAGVSAALVLFLSVPYPGSAYAEDIDTNPVADSFQLEVERTAAAYDEAVAATAQEEEAAE